MLDVCISNSSWWSRRSLGKVCWRVHFQPPGAGFQRWELHSRTMSRWCSYWPWRREIMTISQSCSTCVKSMWNKRRQRLREKLNCIMGNKSPCQNTQDVSNFIRIIFLNSRLGLDSETVTISIKLLVDLSLYQSGTLNMISPTVCNIKHLGSNVFS